jgi:hypothetical protein
MTVDDGGRLSDDELRQLSRLLTRFCEYDLDQWEAWRITTSYGPVFVRIDRELPPGVPKETADTAYHHITEPPAGPSAP